MVSLAFPLTFAFSAVEYFLDFVVFFAVDEVWRRWKRLFLFGNAGGVYGVRSDSFEGGMYVPG